MTSPPPQTPPRTVYLNGDYLPEDQAKISIFDRGFLMADAIYEVVAVIDGELIDFSPHIARLTRSLREVDFDYPIDEQELHNIMSALISRNQLKNGRVYFQITRGNPGDRDFVYDKTTAPTIVLFTQTEDGSDDHQATTQGWSVMTCEDLRWGRCDIKSVQLLYPSMVKTMATRGGFDDAWFVQDGMVTEGTSNNAWLIKDEVLITRERSRDILHGVTRAMLLGYAKERGMRIDERAFSVAEAMAADEAFVTASSLFVMPVVRIDNHAIGDGQPGAHALALRDLYAQKSTKWAR